MSKKTVPLANLCDLLPNKLSHLNVFTVFPQILRSTKNRTFQWTKKDLIYVPKCFILNYAQRRCLRINKDMKMLVNN